MISYEIVRNKPPETGGTFERFRQRRDEWLKNRQQTPPVFDLRPATNLNGDALPPKPLEGPSASVAVEWMGGKHQYNKWLNEHVYNHFYKGLKVTIRSEAYIPDQAPRVWFEVKEIQEIHYMAQIDRETKEPKCIGINTPKYSIPIWYPPCMLRVLQQSEVDAIDRLRNQATGSAEVRDASGEPLRRDPSTGEIVEEN